MRAERETCDDPEVAPAATAARPVEVGMVLRVGDDHLPVRGDDLQREHVVGREPPRTRREAESAAQRMAADTDARARACGDRKPARSETVVDVPEARAGSHEPVPLRDRDALQPLEVDHDAVRDRRVAAVAVPARPRDDVDAGLRRPADDGCDVGRVERLDDREGLDGVVDAVVLEPCELVAGPTPREDGAADRGGERLDARIRSRPDPVGDRKRGSQPHGTDEQVATVQQMRPEGFEPPTNGLEGRRSSTELRAPAPKRYSR